MKNDIIRPFTQTEYSGIPERKRRSRWTRSVVMAGVLALTFIASALVIPDRAQGQPPPPPSKPTQTPIDGGLGLLAAAGGAYAVKKLRDRKTG